MKYITYLKIDYKKGNITLDELTLIISQYYYKRKKGRWISQGRISDDRVNAFFL